MKWAHTALYLEVLCLIGIYIPEHIFQELHILMSVHISRQGIAYAPVLNLANSKFMYIFNYPHPLLFKSLLCLGGTPLNNMVCAGFGWDRVKFFHSG